MDKKAVDKEMAEYRKAVDEIDRSMAELFQRRMEVAKKISGYKVAHNLAIYDPDREKAVVSAAQEQVSPEIRNDVTMFMRTLCALSRGYQQRLMLPSKPREFLPNPRPHKTGNLRVCYQGAPGAWAEQAARNLFPPAGSAAALQGADYAEDVFRRVKDGDADYGVLPIENSKTGAVGETYDLLRSYGCYIVARTWIDERYCLLGQNGASMKDIREVHSLPSGFRQCRRFLTGKSWDLSAAGTMAEAASKVAAGGARTAAIASRIAAEHNGLAILAEDIMDTKENRTSFVVISDHPEYGPESNLVSFSFSIAHRAGSLCEALLPFTASGVNLTRIESRPSASPQTYRFFAEVEGNIAEPNVAETLRCAADVTEYFEVIGCYRLV